MKKVVFAILAIVLGYASCHAQRTETKNLIIVTLDGLRWQELFKGPDPDISFNRKYAEDQDAVNRYWRRSKEERRKALMPFMWTVVANSGQLYGNRHYRNKVNCTNRHLISYPGYSDMLVGFRNRKISSNKKIVNPEPTVLEVIGRDFRFKDEVAAFTTWDTFDYILRKDKSNIYVNAGSDLSHGDISEHERFLNGLQESGHPRNDSITFQYAMEYLRRVRPRVTFIGFDGTDHYAHAGQYDQYLNAAHRADRMIARLWAWIQSQPDYKNQTTLFITTDHGRGYGKHNWRKHRLLTAGSRHIWFAVIGPDTPAFGEMKIKSTTFQTQTAKTLAAFLGLPYEADKPVGEVVQTMIAIPARENAMSLFSEQ